MRHFDRRVLSKNGDVEKVQKMIESDPNLAINAKANNGLSAVITAAYYNELSIGELLVSRRAGLTIYEASAVGKTEAVKKILEEEHWIICLPCL
jgi:hypothetical protein